MKMLKMIMYSIMQVLWNLPKMELPGTRFFFNCRHVPCCAGAWSLAKQSATALSQTFWTSPQTPLKTIWCHKKFLIIHFMSWMHYFPSSQSLLLHVPVAVNFSAYHTYKPLQLCSLPFLLSFHFIEPLPESSHWFLISDMAFNMW
jgi:hypothetical protein